MTVKYLYEKPLVAAEKLGAFPDPSSHTIYLLRRGFLCYTLIIRELEHL